MKKFLNILFQLFTNLLPGNLFSGMYETEEVEVNEFRNSVFAIAVPKITDF